MQQFFARFKNNDAMVSKEGQDGARPRSQLVEKTMGDGKTKRILKIKKGSALGKSVSRLSLEEKADKVERIKPSMGLSY